MNEKKDEDRGFLKGIRPSTFLSTHEEWHAFVIGFCEVLCPLPSRHKNMRQDLQNQVMAEYHYYQSGRAIGVIAGLIIATIIKEVCF